MYEAIASHLSHSLFIVFLHHPFAGYVIASTHCGYATTATATATTAVTGNHIGSSTRR